MNTRAADLIRTICFLLIAGGVAITAAASDPPYNMAQYFDLEPGNTWTYEGVFRGNGENARFWQHYEVLDELAVPIRGFDVIPVVITRYPKTGYEQLDIGGYGGRYRHLIIYFYVSNSTCVDIYGHDICDRYDGIGLVGSRGLEDLPGSGVRYSNNPAPIPATYCFQDENDYQGRIFAPYFYSLISLHSISFGHDASYNRYGFHAAIPMSTTPPAITICNTLPSSGSSRVPSDSFNQGPLNVRFEEEDVNAWVSPVGFVTLDAVVNKQWEKWSTNGCTREDWYFVEDVGMVKLTQNSPASCSSPSWGLSNPSTARQTLWLRQYCKGGSCVQISVY